MPDLTLTPEDIENEFYQTLTLVLDVKDLKWWQLRMWIAVLMIKLAAWFGHLRLVDAEDYDAPQEDLQ